MRKKRTVRRVIAGLSVIILLTTVNSLKMEADTLEHLPSCGMAEHAHGERCYDDGGALICGVAEHVHTDACYQTRPQSEIIPEEYTEVLPTEVAFVDEADATAVEALPEEVALDLGDDNEPDAGMEAVASYIEEAETLIEDQYQEPEFSFRDREFALASEITALAGLDMAQVTDVSAVVEDEEAPCVGIEALDGDWVIYPTRDFEAAELAFFAGESLEVVRLTDGYSIAVQEDELQSDTAAARAESDLADASPDESAEQTAVVRDEDAGIEAGETADEARIEVHQENKVEEPDQPAEAAPAETIDAESTTGDVKDAGAESQDEAPAEADETSAEADETSAEAGEVSAEAGDVNDEHAAGEAEGVKADSGNEDEEVAEPTETSEDREAPAEEIRVTDKEIEKTEENTDKGEEEAEKIEEDTDKAEEEIEKAEEDTDKPEEETDETEEDTDRAEEEIEKVEEDTDKAEEETEKVEEGTDKAEDETDKAEDETDKAEENTDKGEEEAEKGEEDTDEAEEETDKADEDTEKAEEVTEKAAEETDADSEKDAGDTEKSDEENDRSDADGEAEAKADEAEESGEEIGEADESDADTEADDQAALEIDAEGGGTYVSEDENAAAASDTSLTVDLAGMNYPLSLRALMAAFRSEPEDVPAAAEALEVAAAPMEAVEAFVEEATEELPGEGEAASSDETAPVNDPETAEPLTVEYDEAVLSVEVDGDDCLITPIAAFERTDLVVNDVYEITLLNGSVELTWPAQHFEGATDYLTVSVEADEGAFPEGTTMHLTDVADEALLTDIEGAATTADDFLEVQRVHAVDITFVDRNGAEIEPLIPISVEMTVNELEQGEETVVVHMDDDGNTEICEPEREEVVSTPMTMTFSADSFSVYAVVVAKKLETRYITAGGETYNFTVSYGPEAEIPAGAALDVRELTDDEAATCLADVEGALDEYKIITSARFFDIRIMDGDEAVQPAVPVTVQAQLVRAEEEADENAAPCAVHFAGEQTDVVDAADTGETVVFRAAGFSVWGLVYTVDFHYTVNGETFDYSLPGGDCASLRTLLDALEIAQDDPETEANEAEEFLSAVEAVEFSNPELVSIAPVTGNTTVGALREALALESQYSDALTEEDRAAIDARELTAPDWALFSLAPFTTDETLTIAMKNGDSFAIAVTDAQIATRVMTADGQTYTITLTFGPEANIPQDAELKAEEIELWSDTYARYLADASAVLDNDNADSAVTFARFFDIQILHGEEKLEPAAPVYVSIKYDDAIQLGDDDTLSVVHFAENDSEEEPEVIEDIALNDTGTEISYIQRSFSVTGTVVSTPVASNPLQPEHPYAIIIQHTDGNYYVVENDCTLTRIDSSDIEFNYDGTIKSAKMINPVFWTYTDIGYNHGNFWHDTRAREFDGALPKAYTRRYLSVDVDSGYMDLDDTDVHEWGRAIQYNAGNDVNHHFYHYDYNNHQFNHYLGVKQDPDGTLRFCGKKSASEAATIYLAEAQSVSNVAIRNHTVNHIDISVEASAKIEMPLSYGTYRLREVDDQGELTDVYRDEDLVVSAENEVTLKVEKKVPIDSEDIKKADITSYVIKDGKRVEKNDVYRVTGYSQNAEAVNDTPQIRLEGSFKVADLDPVPWNTGENDANICAQRLQSRIYYDVALTKPVPFRMTYKDEATGKTYAVIKDNGEPFDLTIDVSLSTSFDFWNPANTCPGVCVIANRDTWLTGVIPNNGWWNQQTGLDGGPGMDFRLGDTEFITAIQVTKYVQGDDGSAVHMLPLEEGTDCLIDVYQFGEKIHDKTISVGTDGIGMIYDYDVVGGTYSNPAKANISEVADSVADEVIDSEGNRWSYDRSRVETEYVWRNNDHPERHISKDYHKDTDEEFLGEYEILGQYRSDHWPNNLNHGDRECNGEEFNSFLEFYVYNIYKPKTYPVKIKKVDTANPNADTGLAGAKFDLYGPYDTQLTDESARKATRINTEDIVTPAEGIVSIGDLKTGYYYLYETEAPAGYIRLSEPIEIHIDSALESEEHAEVSYVQTYNGEQAHSPEGHQIEPPTSANGNCYVLTVTNTAGVKLPATGGTGTAMFYAIGALLTLAAMALLIRKRSFSANDD